MKKKDDTDRAIVYLIGLVGGYYAGLKIAPSISLSLELSSFIGMILGGYVAYRYLHSK